MTNHLLRNHHHGLYGESPVAVVEEILERWSEEVDDQDVVEAFLAEVVDIRNSRCSRSVSGVRT
jgi:hypothetical protein